MKPTPPTKILHNLQGHLEGFQSLIFLLNSFIEVKFFKLSGIIDQILGPKLNTLNFVYHKLPY